MPGSPGPPPAPPPPGPRRPGLPGGWGRAEVEAGTSGTPVPRWFPEGGPPGGASGAPSAWPGGDWASPTGGGVSRGPGVPEAASPRPRQPDPRGRAPQGAGSRRAGWCVALAPRSSRPPCPRAQRAPRPGSLRRGTPPEPGPARRPRPGLRPRLRGSGGARWCWRKGRVGAPHAHPEPKGTNARPGFPRLFEFPGGTAAPMPRSL